MQCDIKQDQDIGHIRTYSNHSYILFTYNVNNSIDALGGIFMKNIKSIVQKISNILGGHHIADKNPTNSVNIDDHAYLIGKCHDKTCVSRDNCPDTIYAQFPEDIDQHKLPYRLADVYTPAKIWDDADVQIKESHLMQDVYSGPAKIWDDADLG